MKTRAQRETFGALRRRRAGGWIAAAVAALLMPLGCAQTPPQSVESNSEPASLAPTPLREAMQAGPVAVEPLTWTADGGLGAKLTLLGSIHFGPPAGWSYPPVVLEAFAEATVLVVEADDRSLSPAEQQELVARYAFIAPPRSLEDLISAETNARLRSYLETRHLAFESMQRLRPWMISTLLIIDAVTELGFNPLTGVDHVFLGMAGNREIVPLESVEFQMRLMADLDDDLQELALIDTLDEVDDAGAMMLDLADAWRSGDESRLTELLYDAMMVEEDFAPLAEVVLHARNRSMARELFAIASDANRSGQRVFVVIGAAHFVGEDNIVDQLARRGLHVERINGKGTNRPVSPSHVQ